MPDPAQSVGDTLVKGTVPAGYSPLVWWMHSNPLCDSARCHLQNALLCSHFSLKAVHGEEADFIASLNRRGN